MKISISYSVLVLLISLTFFHLVAAQRNSLGGGVLQRRVPGEELEYVATTDAFHSSLGRTKLPGGMVRLLRCEQDAFMQGWRPGNEPLGKVLDDIVSADQRYRWEMQSGVINLLPEGGEPPLLRTHVTRFYLQHLTSPSTALDYVLRSPEVQTAMSEQGIRPGVSLVKALSSHPQEFSIRYAGGTLRQALNAIALAHGRGIWEYIETHCNGKSEVVVRF